MEIIPLAAIPEVAPGSNLAEHLVSALAGLRVTSRDVVVVTQKIVSKAESRFVSLSAVEVTAEARTLAGVVHKDPRLVQLVLDESASVVRAAPHVLITRHRSGHVMANAGIDQSNIGPGSDDRVLLLPEDSDLSAARIREGIAARIGTAPAVVISDSFGRPWRMGVVCVAIGAAGLPALMDRRGEADRNGRILEVTQVAVADLLASAAGLVMGEGAEGVPAVLIRGASWSGEDAPAARLVRPTNEDLFR